MAHMERAWPGEFVLERTHAEAIKPTFSQMGHEFDGPREFIAKKKGVSNWGSRGLTTSHSERESEWSRFGVFREACSRVVLLYSPTDASWHFEHISSISFMFHSNLYVRATPHPESICSKGWTSVVSCHVAQATGQATVTVYPLTFKPDYVCDVKAGCFLIQSHPEFPLHLARMLPSNTMKTGWCWWCGIMASIWIWDCAMQFEIQTTRRRSF